jgi:FkbM family methyltransferase
MKQQGIVVLLLTGISCLAVLHHVFYNIESNNMMLNIDNIEQPEDYDDLRSTSSAAGGGDPTRTAESSRSDRITSVYRCKEKPLSALAKNMKSQVGEDGFLLGRFNGLCGGTYMELGALDGVRYSNTHVFNKEFNWKGVMIEISPLFFSKLQKNRPNEIALVNAAVCNRRQKIHFVQAKNNAVSGVYEFASEAYRQRWWPSLKDPNDLPEIHCLPMQDILDKHAPGVSFFDVLSLDVEGAELSVLKSIDFSKTSFGMLVVEVRASYAPDVRALLVQQGYIPYDGHDQDKLNAWFIHQNFSDIYADI